MDDGDRTTLINILNKLNDSDRADLGQALITQALEAAKPPTPEDEAALAEELPKRVRLLSEKHEFDAGMLVEWKPGLKNRRRPAYGAPAVVVEVLTEPVLSTSDESGSSYFREPLDLIAGIIDSEGDFIWFYYDKRRFQPFGRGR